MASSYTKVLALTQSLFRGLYTKELVWSKVLYQGSIQSIIPEPALGRSDIIRSSFVSKWKDGLATLSVGGKWNGVLAAFDGAWWIDELADTCMKHA